MKISCRSAIVIPWEEDGGCGREENVEDLGLPPVKDHFHGELTEDRRKAMAEVTHVFLDNK
jgi:hypothetical protein